MEVNVRLKCQDAFHVGLRHLRKTRAASRATVRRLTGFLCMSPGAASRERY